MSKEIKNYLPVNRKFFDHPFWTKERVFSEAEAWLYLLKEARFEVSEGSKLIKGKIVKWGRGEVPASLRYLAERWKWDKNKVARFLELLVNEDMITRRTANGTDQSIITLCNYDSYNAVIKSSGQLTGQTRDSDGTVTGQTRDNTNTVNNGNSKEEKKESADAQISDSEQQLELPITLAPDRPNWAPSWEEVKTYFASVKHPQLARRFFEHHESRGWMVGKQALLHFAGEANGWIKNSKGKPRKKADLQIPDRLMKPPDRKAFYSDEEYDYAVKRRGEELQKLGIKIPA